jgi:Flp pilus assembly protein TadD
VGSVLERAGRPDEAAAAYRQALDGEPHHLGASRALARLLARTGRPDEAARLLEEVAAARPRAAQPLADLAAIHELAGERDRAAAAYRRALERDSRNPILMNNLAYLIGRDPQALPEALELAEQARRRAPRSAAVADTLGWLLYQKGELARAAELLREAAAGAPKNATIRYHLGLVLARQGRTDDARREIEEALRGGPFPEAEAARQLLRSLGP